MGWGGDIRKYTSSEDFQKEFPNALKVSGIRVLKQYRGNGGNGVFKIVLKGNDTYSLTHAAVGSEEQILSGTELNNFFHKFFLNGGLIID